MKQSKAFTGYIDGSKITIKDEWELKPATHTNSFKFSLNPDGEPRIECIDSEELLPLALGLMQYLIANISGIKFMMRCKPIKISFSIRDGSPHQIKIDF